MISEYKRVNNLIKDANNSDIKVGWMSAIRKIDKKSGNTIYFTISDGSKTFTVEKDRIRKGKKDLTSVDVSDFEFILATLRMIANAVKENKENNVK